MTIVEVLKLTAGYLQKHGSESSRLDAELLLAHALKLKRLDLYLKFDHQLNESVLSKYRALVARRAKGEPVAYLVGREMIFKLRERYRGVDQRGCRCCPGRAPVA